jgi:hypothetical protein
MVIPTRLNFFLRNTALNHLVSCMLRIYKPQFDHFSIVFYMVLFIMIQNCDTFYMVCQAGGADTKIKG